jgi:SAM-dependent methyltransferase
MLKLYDELAKWWPLFSPPEDYEEEADDLQRLILTAYPHRPATFLELGSGGGSNAFHLKAYYPAMTLVDISPKMLAVSRTYNPECEHLEGDMRTVRLDRLFDIVFVHDAIVYMTTLDALRQVMETAFVHCRPGGLAVFVPDEVRETFEPQMECGGKDGDGRALRYIEWSVDPDENDTTYTTDYVLMLREGNQAIHIEHDHHVEGLFPRADWLRLLSEIGFQTEVIHDSYRRDVFVAHKPA